MFSAGTRLGPYEIVALLGAGGMGEVYRARDPRLEREVAVKVLPAAFTADPDRLRRFEHEARAAAALNHPNILAVHDIGTSDGSAFIVSELLEGETLRERLEHGSRTGRDTDTPHRRQDLIDFRGASGGVPIPVRKAVDYAIQIAHGLAVTHDRGIVHRDLKPENVFLTAAGQIKILDFGVAKLTEAASARSQFSQAATALASDGNQEKRGTEPGTVLGTVAYMAPEQVRGLPADQRSDFFAFGAVLYEMLSGQRPFTGATSADIMTAILERDPPELPVADRRIPPGLARIVDRCLEKNPSARFQNASDLAFALEALSSTSMTGADVASAAEGVVARFLHSARLAWLIAGLFGLATLLLVLIRVNYLGGASVEPLVTRLDIVTPPSTDPFYFAVSPDGRKLVFVANGPSGAQLWLRPLDQVVAQPLAGTDKATYPFWAPDSRAIGFFADGKLKRLDLGGGAPRVLANASQGRGGTWNDDDVIVFAPTATSALMRVSATGGTPTPVTQLGSGQQSHRWPQFLADGRRVLFLVALGQAQSRGAYMVPLEGGTPARVLATETSVLAASGHLLRVSQGVLVGQPFDVDSGSVTGELVPLAQLVGSDNSRYHAAFSVSSNMLAFRAGTASAQRQLVWIDRTGKAVGTLGSPDDNSFAHPTLAPDGRRVAAFRHVQGNGDVWLMDVARGVGTRLTFDDANDSSPVWSPDGDRVVFRCGRNGVYDLFEKVASGAGTEMPVLVTGQNKAPLDWSQNGRVLLYATEDASTGASDLWALPLTGVPKPIPVLQTRFDEIQGQLSPDGRWLAYVSNESGGYEVFVRPFSDGGGQWQVSSGGGTQPRWRKDGRELFYVSADGRMMAVPVRVGATRAFDYGAPVALFPTRLASGPAINATGYSSIAQYTVSGDGRFLMNVAADEAVNSPINIVLNWTALLGR